MRVGEWDSGPGLGVHEALKNEEDSEWLGRPEG